MSERSTPALRAGRAGKDAARRVGERLVARRLQQLEHDLRIYADDVARTTAASAQVRADALHEELAALSDRLADVDQRLGDMERALHELGGALSREHGLAGAPSAYREAVYLLHELRRDLRRHLTDAGPEPAEPGPLPAAAATGAADPYAGKHPRRFDYAGFERRFRGDPEHVRALLLERYGELLTPLGPVVDIGCGRGELLEALVERGVDVVGVEPDAALAAEARERGVRVEEVLGAQYLRGVDDESLGAVVCFHVVEHLVVDDLIELLELAARKLRPGGVFVAETPNPMTFLTLHESYLLDPTHVQPLHPALLGWLAEASGFRSVEVSYWSPADSLHLPRPADDDRTALAQTVRDAFDRLDHQLYGPQDYSLVARV